jgi:hypothetical protein
VEVEDMLHTHHIFRDFVGNYTLYGVESWIEELQRMWQIFQFLCCNYRFFEAPPAFSSI